LTLADVAATLARRVPPEKRSDQATEEASGT